MGVGKGLTQEPRSTKIEKYFPEAPVRIAFSITCLAGSATFGETLIYLKVNIYFTLKKKEISPGKVETFRGCIRIFLFFELLPRENMTEISGGD